ncbi:MAG TPA: ion channel protein Tsx [Anaeromyxobacteraceae bacterium]|nr:ion channel protein Tsx [Anaeromyxobacteraceae bacterium]
MRTSILSRLAAAVVSLTAATAAQAEGFATANVQVLQGFNFKDVSGNGNNTRAGDMNTVTFNYYGTHAYGDLLFFADLTRTRGAFVNAFTGGPDGRTNVYSELQPRFGFGKIFGKNPVPFFKDFGPAFELNQGYNFFAYLGGFGGDFNLPGPYVAGMNLYYRYDQFSYHSWQATLYWGVPFKVGPANMVLAGFADLSGAKNPNDGNLGLDIMTQPQLLVDVGAPFGVPSRFWFGTEYYIHRAPGHALSSAPQLMVQYTLR